MKRIGLWNALAGSVILIVWKIIFYLSLVDLALGFAFLVLVPLALEEVVKNSQGNRAERWIENLMKSSLPFGGAGLIAVTLPPSNEAGWWAAIWLFYTLLLAFGGLMRLWGRGLHPVEETVIDVGLMYIAVGGGWLVLSSADLAKLLPYSEAIVQLTAIHFHYAAFILPVVIGLFGRYRAKENQIRQRFMERPYTILVIGIIIGPFLVALGLDQGPPVEVFAVGLYVLVLSWLCLWWFWLSVEFPFRISLSLRISSLVLLGTMALSVIYSLGLMYETYWLGIGNMVRYHGLFNAFGFSLFSLLAWRGVGSPQRYPYTSFPISLLRGNGYIGNQLVYQKGWVLNHVVERGLVPDWDVYRGERFNPDGVDDLVKSFYLHTEDFDMKAKITWAKGFRFLSKVSRRLTRLIGQVNLPGNGVVHMAGEVVSISDEKDGRKNVRAWVRRDASSDEPIFTALYAHHVRDSETYMNIGLPFPLGILTGILALEQDDDGGLILTSHLRKDGQGDEGIYFTVGDWTIRTPLREKFHVWVGGHGELMAEHHMTLGKIPFLHIEYQLDRKPHS